MKTVFLLITSIILFSGCNNDDTNDDCSGIACNESYVVITVTIKDQDLNPFSLDDFKVVNLENGADITTDMTDFEFQLMQQFGVYPLFGDEYLREFENQELEIQFKGILSNQEIIVENYIVSTNCCHVFLISGDNELIIN